MRFNGLTEWNISNELSDSGVRNLELLKIELVRQAQGRP
jgi:hypothetical protein